MLDFRTFLEEGRDAPLFHGTDAGNANNIMFNNIIKGTTSHTIPFPDQHRAAMKKYKGVSLTRDAKFATYYVFHERDLNTAILFELDQRLLTQNYKIVPINYYHTTYAYNQTKPDIGARVSRPRAYRGEYNNESEEFVVGDIKNISKYLRKIHVCSEKTKEVIEDKYPILDSHPLLWYSERIGAKGYFYNA